MKTYCKLISRQRFHALEDRVPRASPRTTIAFASGTSKDIYSPNV